MFWDENGIGGDGLVLGRLVGVWATPGFRGNRWGRSARACWIWVGEDNITGIGSTLWGEEGLAIIETSWSWVRVDNTTNPVMGWWAALGSQHERIRVLGWWTALGSQDDRTRV